jgi:hypothetical protein
VWQFAGRKMRHLNQALDAAISAPLSLLGLNGNADLDREN